MHGQDEVPVPQKHGRSARVGVLRASLWRLVHGAEAERGQAAMFMTVVMGFTFIVGLLGINTTMVVASRISAQRAADASALAGCLDLDGTTDGKAIAEQRAIDYAERADRNNTVGFTEGGNFGTSVSVTDSGDIASNGKPLKYNKISVDVQRNQGLLGWAGIGLATKNVPAHAACVREEGFHPILHSLSTGKDSLTMESQINIDWEDGGIVVGGADCSGSDRRLKVTGDAVVDVRHIDVCNGPEGCGEGCEASVQPWPVDDDFLADPFASVPEPEKPTDVVVNNRVTCEDVYLGSWNSSRGCRMTGSVPAGYYPNGLVLYGTVTLQDDGLYYVSNSSQPGLRIEPDAEVTGNRVIFFNGMVGTKCGSIHIDVNAEVLIKPPESGTYKELLFFQARECDAVMTVESSVTLGLKDGPWGTVYLPKGTADIHCNSCTKETDMNARVVAYEIQLKGPINFAEIKIPSGTPKWGDVHLSE
jgi:hypothetical protein